MFLPFLLSALAYGPDVELLGSREYAVREAAHRRLVAAGPSAFPAVWRGMRSDIPEVAERSDQIWRAGRRWDFRLAARLLANPAVEPECVFRTSPDVARLVCEAVDAVGGWECQDSWGWVVRTPFRTGSIEGDFALVVRTARERAGK